MSGKLTYKHWQLYIDGCYPFKPRCLLILSMVRELSLQAICQDNSVNANSRNISSHAVILYISKDDWESCSDQSDDSDGGWVDVHHSSDEGEKVCEQLPAAQ